MVPFFADCSWGEILAIKRGDELLLSWLAINLIVVPNVIFNATKLISKFYAHLFRLYYFKDLFHSFLPLFPFSARSLVYESAQFHNINEYFNLLSTLYLLCVITTLKLLNCFPFLITRLKLVFFFLFQGTFDDWHAL